VRPKFVMILTAIVVGGSVGCSGNSGDSVVTVVTTTVTPVATDESRAAVVNALTTQVIAPAYAGIVGSIDSLSTSIEVACSQPSEATRQTTRDAWRATSASWASTRAVRFGPAMALRAMSKIAFPVDPDKIQALVAGDLAIDQAAVAGLGADQRGLGGLEIVLFGDGALDERRCAYAMSVVALMGDAAKQVANTWQADPPTDTKQFVDDAVNNMIFALSDVADTKLGKASGDISGTPEFAEIDAGPARNALNDMVSILESVDTSLSGGPSAMGLAALLDGQSAGVAERLHDELVAARDAVTAVPAPLATTTDTAPVSAAYQAVLIPLRTLRTEVASLLGVTLTLGDADGDS
jgi:predicted lipoprotein